MDDLPFGVHADVPPDLVRAIREHSQAFVAGDTARLMEDFQPDRAGQLIRATYVPPGGVRGFHIESIEPTGRGVVTGRVRYETAEGGTLVLRARWRRIGDAWRVFQVRNLPETPPRLGTEGPSPDGLDEPYWLGLREGELRIQRCTRCERWIWAPSPICPDCHSFDLDFVAVPQVGTIYSWTRTWQPFAPQTVGHLPYVVVLVELPHAGGRRVLGVLLDADEVTPVIGARVHGEIEPADSLDGWPLLRWRLA